MASYASGSNSKLDKEMEDLLSGGKVKYQKGQGEMSDRYWNAADFVASPTTATETKPYGAGYGAPVMGNEPEASKREQQLKADLANTIYADAARQLGIRKLDSANDLGQALAYLSGGGGKKTAEPAKAAQAVQAAKGWQKQEGQKGGSASGGFSNSSGFVPGGSSYAADLAGSAEERDGLYDNIAQRGIGMVDSFRSIGRDYYMRAGQEGQEIARAGWDALNALSPDVQPTDYINAFTTPLGKNGKTLVAMSRDLING
jgi:hypothetical protein